MVTKEKDVEKEDRKYWRGNRVYEGGVFVDGRERGCRFADGARQGEGGRGGIL